MGVIITPQSEVNRYYDSDCLNQSTLKELQHGVDKFLATLKKREEETEEKSYFIIGGAVDLILTGEEGIFEEFYHISSLLNKPSDTEMSIIKLTFDLIVNNITSNPEEIGFISDYPNIISEAINQIGWQPKWKEETKINKIIDLGYEYFEDLKKACGKTVISVLQKEIIDNIVKSLRENPRTSKYFDRNSLSQETSVDIYYQLPLYFKVEGIDCKALLDFLIVLKNEEGVVTTLMPFDLKTMSGYTIEFPNSVRTRRYDIQAAFYRDALTNPTTIFPENFPNFDRNIVNVKPFTFIVESSNNPGKPLLFKVSEELDAIAKYGKVNHEGRKVVKGYLDLIEEYKYHSSTNWTEEKIVTESNGILELNWEGFL